MNELEKAFAVIAAHESAPAQQPEASASVYTLFLNRYDWFAGTLGPQCYQSSRGDWVKYADIDAWHAAGVAAAVDGISKRLLEAHDMRRKMRSRAEKAEAERDEARRELAEHLSNK